MTQGCQISYAEIRETLSLYAFPSLHGILTVVTDRFAVANRAVQGRLCSAL